MASKNPFQSPVHAGLDGTSGRSVPVLRATGSVLCALAALVMMSLLSGQVFSNSLIILVLCLGSLMLWLPLVVEQGAYQRLARVVILGHIAVAIAIYLSLPAQYKAQQQFNEKMEQLHHPRPLQRKL